VPGASAWRYLRGCVSGMWPAQACCRPGTNVIGTGGAESLRDQVRPEGLAGRKHGRSFRRNLHLQRPDRAVAMPHRCHQRIRSVSPDSQTVFTEVAPDTVHARAGTGQAPAERVTPGATTKDPADRPDAAKKRP
jgi:hypothetical protein